MIAAGALIQPVVAGTLGQSGWPDRLIIHPLWFGFIEFKRGANPLSKIQEYLHREINRRRKFASFVCRFKESGCTDVVIDIEYLGEVLCHNHVCDGAELLITMSIQGK